MGFPEACVDNSVRDAPLCIIYYSLSSFRCFYSNSINSLLLVFFFQFIIACVLLYPMFSHLFLARITKSKGVYANLIGLETAKMSLKYH